MLRWGVFALACAAASTVSCYSPEFKGCNIQCTADSGCPDGMSCAMDIGRCRAIEPEDDTCGDEPVPGRLFASITAGRHHACAIGVDQQLYCWGSNDHGQITGEATLPQQVGLRIVVEGVDHWEMVAAGGDHTCAIGEETDGDKRIYCWGNNQNGECGTSLLDAVTAPKPINAITNPVFIASGRDHSCAITSDSQLLCWGSNGQKQLGNPSGGGITPIEVSGGGTWLAVAPGDENTCAIRNDGTVACWGRNSSGQIGNNTIDPTQDNSQDVDTPEAVVLAELDSNNPALAIAVAFEHVCMIHNDIAQKGGTVVRCWGDNNVAQLGVAPVDDQNEPVPVLVEGLGSTAGWRGVAVGDGFSCAVNDDGKVYCWGTQLSNVLGDNTTASRTSFGADPNLPVVVIPEGEDNAFAVAAGSDFACALYGDRLSGGVARCWGSNSHGNLGTSGISRIARATRSLEPGPWKTVRLATHHGCGIKVDGSVWCWGENDRGQVLPGGAPIEPRPVQIPNIDDADDVSLGNNHTCVLHVADTVTCWGNNGVGELGTTDAGNFKSPDLPGNNWSSIHTGVDVTCVSDPAGEIVCWGQADWLFGGNMTPPQSIGPNIVGTKLRLGADSGCVLDANNDLQCFGIHDHGLRGINTTAGDVSTIERPIDANTNQPIEDVLGASDMDGFAQHRCAYTATMTYCWGANYIHQVDGSSGDVLVATPVQFVTTDIQDPTQRTIAAGGTFTIALNQSGEIGCWGDNTGMQCSVNGHTPLEAPDGGFDLIAVTTDNPPEFFVTIAAGEGNACAVGSDSELYCWGDSPRGETGLGAGAADQDFATTVVGQ